MARVLGVAPQDLYPEYSFNFSASRGRGDKRWWNHIIDQLIIRGWTINEFSRRCGISLSRAHSIVSWGYPPTEKILQRLEKSLKMHRKDFWKDWKHQQWSHYKAEEEDSSDEERDETAWPPRRRR